MPGAPCHEQRTTHHAFRAPRDVHCAWRANTCQKAQRPVDENGALLYIKEQLDAIG
jgi:hypothetical protein